MSNPGDIDKMRASRQAEMREALSDLQRSISLGLSEEDAETVNPTAFEIGFDLGRLRSEIEAKRLRAALILCVALRHKLRAARGHRWPNLTSESLDRIEACLLPLLRDASGPCRRVRDLFETMRDRTGEPAHDHNGGALERPVIPVTAALVAGSELGQIDGLLRNKDWSGSISRLEDSFPDWLDRNHPEYYKTFDQNMTWLLEEAGDELRKEDESYIESTRPQRLTGSA